MQYREEMQVTAPYKKQYVDGFERILEQRQQEATAIRENYAQHIFESPESYRKDFREMLGWPLVGHTASGSPAVVSEKLADEETYTLYRMHFDILDGLTMSGLFFRLKGDEKKPLVIVQHGGLGTPERVSGAYGDTGNHNCIVERVVEQGVHAFAPQLLLWGEKYEVPFDRRPLDAKLKRVGSSITALEIYGITRILDYFETQSYVKNFGMVGLSYGGFYTLFTTAADTRIRAAYSCSFFNTRDRIGWSDWTWQCSAEKFDDAEVACLVYPRKLYIRVGNADELFDCRYAIESFETLKKRCHRVGTDWVDFAAFEGVHEFCNDDTPIKNLVNDLL